MQAKFAEYISKDVFIIWDKFEKLLKKNSLEFEVHHPGLNFNRRFRDHKGRLHRFQLQKFLSENLYFSPYEQIQTLVPSRTKRECMLRFKELAEMAKAKKAAQAKAQKMNK